VRGWGWSSPSRGNAAWWWLKIRPELSEAPSILHVKDGPVLQQWLPHAPGRFFGLILSYLRSQLIAHRLAVLLAGTSLGPPILQISLDLDKSDFYFIFLWLLALPKFWLVSRLRFAWVQLADKGSKSWLQPKTRLMPPPWENISQGHRKLAFADLQKVKVDFEFWGAWLNECKFYCLLHGKALILNLHIKDFSSGPAYNFCFDCLLQNDYYCQKCNDGASLMLVRSEQSLFRWVWNKHKFSWVQLKISSVIETDYELKNKII